MIDFLKKHILHTKTLTIVAGLVAFGAFIAAGYILFSMPQEAQAQSCRTVSLDSSNTSGSGYSYVREDYGSNWDTDNREYSYSSDTPNELVVDVDSVSKNADEYYSSFTFNVDARASAVQGGAAAALDIGDDGSDEYSVYAEGGDEGDVDEIYETHTMNLSGGSSITLRTEASTQIDRGNNHSGYASMGVENLEIEVCEDPNEPPVAVGDGTKGVTYNSPTSVQVLGNDYDPDNGPSGIYVQSAWSNKSGSSASPNSSNSEVVYDPGSLSPGSSDTVTYRISDGEDTDTATFNVDIADETASVSVSAPGGTTYTPKWNGGNLDSGNGNKTYYGLNLSTSPKIFEVPESSISAASGYTYSNMSKSVPAGNQTGNQYSAELGVSYTEYHPEASFTYSPSSPDHGDTVTFDASGSSDQDGSISSYSWSFGDGGSGSGQTYSRSFSVGGSYSAQSYSAKLTVTDNDGHKDSISKTVSVSSQDSDGDGVYDRNDSCTYSYGEGSDGCPIDSDGDGVYDHDDSCPNNYGEGSDGCPTDSDGDGVYDKYDSCPNTWGSLSNGCPDDDGTIKEPKQF